MMIQYGLIHNNAHRVKSVTRFLSEEVPARADANSLIKCIETSLKPLGIMILQMLLAFLPMML